MQISPCSPSAARVLSSFKRRISVFLNGKPTGMFIALIVAVAGVLVAWLSSVLLYGYGQLIDSQQDVVEELSEIKKVLKKNLTCS